MLCSNVDLPTLCSTYDRGGGALSASTFMVYTTATLPSSFHSLIANPPLALLELATAIAERIPIHITCSSLDGELTTLPCPKAGSGSRGRSKEVDQLPWFFINAAKCSKHAIAGRGSVLETLLSVLQRPWCALELCCAAPVEALRVLVAFTSYLTQLGFSVYETATVMLAHEVNSRDLEENGEGHDPVWLRSSLEGLERPSAGRRRRRTYTSAADLRQMYVVVFGGSMRTYQGFWLRLVTVVGLELGVRYSRVGLLLNPGSKDGDVGRTRTVRCGLKRSVSMVEVWRRGIERDGKESFVIVYRNVLRRLGE